MKKTLQWEYRAYGPDLEIIEGTAQATSFVNLAFTLRQQGLQVIEATQLSPDSTMGRQRLQKMKQRIQPTEQDEQPSSTIRNKLRSVIGLFRKRNDA